MEIVRSGRRSGTPTLPSLPPKSTSLSCVSEASSVGSGSLTSRLRKNSAKMRKRQTRANTHSSPLQSAKSVRSNISKTSYDSRRTMWDYTPILTEDEYSARKERLLKHCKLKKDLEAYWNVETPSRLERRRLEEMPSDDSDYDTDLDQDLVGLELIVDEKTKQIKDDGIFPEYKKMCRKLKVVPNHYFIRHSMDEGIAMKHRYFSPNDCLAIGKEMKIPKNIVYCGLLRRACCHLSRTFDPATLVVSYHVMVDRGTLHHYVNDNLTFSTVDLEDNGINGRHLTVLGDMIRENHYLSDMSLRDNPIGAAGAALIRNALLNNSHIVRLDISGAKLGELGGKYCAEIIEYNSCLREINIGRNGIGDVAAMEIGKALESNSTLESLDISWNNISRFGACSLAIGLKHNTQLRSLTASMNGFERTGGIAILEMLRSNHTLTSLDLSANRINDDITDVFARVVPNNRAIQSINLSFNLISSDGAMKMLKPLTSKMRKNRTLNLITLDGIDVNTEVAIMIEKLKEKRGIEVIVRIPPSRREKTMDSLTGSLIFIVNFAEQEEIDLLRLFPKSYEEKGAMISTDDVIELIKHSGKDISKTKISDLRRKLEETRDRRFELSELLDVYHHVKNNHDPYREHPLRSRLAGKKRGKPTDATQRPSTHTAGVRFMAGES